MQERKHRLSGNVLLSIFLAIVLLAGIGFGAWILIGKDKNQNSGVKGTDVELAAYAIHKVEERGSEIYKTYADSTSKDNNVSLLQLNQKEMQPALIGSSLDKRLEQLQKYYYYLSQCNVVPFLMDFVLNSSSSEVYTNKFELGKTYMARDDDCDMKYYVKIEKEGSLVNCYFAGYVGEVLAGTIICQIDYDFINDKLLSAKTVANVDSLGYCLLLFIDYEKNDFVSSEISFQPEKSVNDVFNGNLKYEDVTINSFFRGNIASSINAIEFEELNSDDSSAGAIFNSYLKNFSLGIETESEKFFDFENFVINNAIIDGQFYSTNKIQFSVRVNPNNKFEYQYISTWVEFEDAIKLVSNVIEMEELNDKVPVKQLLTAYKNRLNDRGKYSYVGDLNFKFDENNYLEIVKISDEVDCFTLSVVVDEEQFEIVCQYQDGELVLKENLSDPVKIA